MTLSDTPGSTLAYLVDLGAVDPQTQLRNVTLMAGRWHLCNGYRRAGQPGNIASAAEILESWRTERCDECVVARNIVPDDPKLQVASHIMEVAMFATRVDVRDSEMYPTKTFDTSSVRLSMNSKSTWEDEPLEAACLELVERKLLEFSHTPLHQAECFRWWESALRDADWLPEVAGDPQSLTLLMKELSSYSNRWATTGTIRVAAAGWAHAVSLGTGWFVTGEPISDSGYSVEPTARPTELVKLPLVCEALVGDDLFRIPELDELEQLGTAAASEVRHYLRNSPSNASPFDQVRAYLSSLL